MKLQDIGFYTLDDSRAENASVNSPLWRCELILTDRCNFKCPYCRGVRDDIQGTMNLDYAKKVVDMWVAEGLRNIRFSGGEPVLYPGLIALVQYTKTKGVGRIAISTNGSADVKYYKELVNAGVNDFSVSLDACCASFAAKMSGGVDGVWETVINNIKTLASLTYVTVGVVVTEENIGEVEGIIAFAESLQVSDIRIISAAQFNKTVAAMEGIKKETLRKFPILNYRAFNSAKGRSVRGIKDTDSRKCALVLDDMAVAGEYHFPCIIYLREGGDPIGRVGVDMRKERASWYTKHDTHKDRICKNNCLDVCIDYNNKYDRYRIARGSLPRLNSLKFNLSRWSAGSIHDFGVACRFDELTRSTNKAILREHAIGWAFSEIVPCRPKENQVAVMFYAQGREFWFHIRLNEFVEIFGPEVGK